MNLDKMNEGTGDSTLIERVEQLKHKLSQERGEEEWRGR